MEHLINFGAYAVIYYLKEGNKIAVPRFGEYFLRKGWYVYSGSAKKNMIHRVSRHIRKEKKLKWHIDYFSVLDNVIPKEIFLFEHRNECEINRLFKEAGGGIIIDNFGATDCKNKCGTHFLYFKKLPKLEPVVDFGGINGKLLILQNYK
jgi:sugar fermentation stimulation protein A